MADRRRDDLTQLDRSAEASDPDIGAMLQPIIVRDARKSALAPVLAPRVLDPEPIHIIGNNSKGVAAFDLSRVGNDAIFTNAIPARVHASRGVENADFRQSAVHRHQVFVIDSEVSPE